MPQHGTLEQPCEQLQLARIDQIVYGELVDQSSRHATVQRNPVVMGHLGQNFARSFMGEWIQHVAVLIGVDLLAELENLRHLREQLAPGADEEADAQPRVVHACMERLEELGAICGGRMSVIELLEVVEDEKRRKAPL